ncbi:MAG: hypothetical protein V1716_04375 [Candidatus Uhrbacteria bacterium]
MDKLRTALFVIGLLGAVLTVANFSVCRWSASTQSSGLAWCGGWPDFNLGYEAEPYLPFYYREVVLQPGTYIVFSVSQSEDVWDSEANGWTTTNDKTIYRYRIESGEKEILKTFENEQPVLYKNGYYISFFNGETWKDLSLDGQEKQTEVYKISSNNGEFFVTGQGLNFGSGEMPVARDGLAIKAFNKNDDLIGTTEIRWSNIGYEMAEAGVWFISDNGNDIYVWGRTIEAINDDIFWKVSLATNEWQEISRLKTDAEESDWVTWYDGDNEKITYLINKRTDNLTIVNGVDLPSGETKEL